MERTFFLTTERVAFSHWQEADLPLARLLWGEEAVTQYICASGTFSETDIAARLEKELENQRQFHVQYWPFFEKATQELIGCCGLRPSRPGVYELGFHLRSAFWRQGYAPEAARAVIAYAFGTLGAEELVAGHHPQNLASQRVLEKLGFRYVGDEFYAPTGLNHPSYVLRPTD